MMHTLEDTLVKDKIITQSGRVFRPGNKEFLDNTPPDIVQEMAKRRLEEINRHKNSTPQK